jgi:hypothetical protein
MYKIGRKVGMKTKCDLYTLWEDDRMTADGSLNSLERIKELNLLKWVIRDEEGNPEVRIPAGTRVLYKATNENFEEWVVFPEYVEHDHYHHCYPEQLINKLLESVKWEVDVETEDEKQLEAIAGKYQLDMHIDYVHGILRLQITEDMYKRDENNQGNI